jgi:ubiquitin-like modifier-activating enzyme ATG7
MEENKRLQKFSRVCSEVEPSFWHKQSQLKLDVDRLNENERNISGHYTNRGTFCLDVTAFNRYSDNAT